MTKHINANVLEYASLFLFVAAKQDIEAERQRLECEHGMQLDVFSIEYPSHSGTRCTRVTWQESS